MSEIIQVISEQRKTVEPNSLKPLSSVNQMQPSYKTGKSGVPTKETKASNDPTLLNILALAMRENSLAPRCSPIRLERSSDHVSYVP